MRSRTSLFICLSLALILLTEAALSQTNLLIPNGKTSDGRPKYLTFEDLNEIKNLLYAVLGIFIPWLLSQIYSAFQNKGKKMAEDIATLLEMQRAQQLEQHAQRMQIAEIKGMISDKTDVTDVIRIIREEDANAERIRGTIQRK